MPGLDWKPARVPKRVPLEGANVVLEPVDPARHAASLFASSKDAPELWRHLAYGPFKDQQELTRQQAELLKIQSGRLELHGVMAAALCSLRRHSSVAAAALPRWGRHVRRLAAQWRR